ncbi:cell division protein ZapA [bacterium]|nr:cell division protein ZapA [bacterium]
MKFQTFSIFGKKYKIQSNLSEDQIKKIIEEIDKRITSLQREYPSSDKIDLLFFYVLELHELLIKMEKEQEKLRIQIKRAKSRIENLENEIKKEIENLTRTA